MNWNQTSSVLPPNGTLCKTISPGGIETELIFENGLWFFPDKSMYVYYVPQFWRPVNK